MRGVDKNNLYYKKRRYLKIATFLALGVVVGALGASQYANNASRNAVTLTAEQAAVSTTIQSLQMTAAQPTRLLIEQVDIDASFESPLGLQENNEIAVPYQYDTVGYYKYGPTPGEIGPAVVLGHVDSYLGPAVFWKLRQLDIGDRVTIERADGSVAVFAVTSAQEHQQSGFPTEQVYSDIDHAGLRLITCSGTYDRSSQRYSHNFIVYAELVATSTADRLQ